MIGSELFYSMIVEGKKEFLKKLSVIRINDTFSTFLLNLNLVLVLAEVLALKRYLFLYIL